MLLPLHLLTHHPLQLEGGGSGLIRNTLYATRKNSDHYEAWAHTQAGQKGSLSSYPPPPFFFSLATLFNGCSHTTPKKHFHFCLIWRAKKTVVAWAHNFLVGKVTKEGEECESLLLVVVVLLLGLEDLSVNKQGAGGDGTEDCKSCHLGTFPVSLVMCARGWLSPKILNNYLCYRWVNGQCSFFLKMSFK